MFGAIKQHALFFLINKERLIARLGCWRFLEEEKLTCLLCQANTGPAYTSSKTLSKTACTFAINCLSSCVKPFLVLLVVVQETVEKKTEK